MTPAGDTVTVDGTPRHDADPSCGGDACRGHAIQSDGVDEGDLPTGDVHAAAWIAAEPGTVTAAGDPRQDAGV